MSETCGELGIAMGVAVLGSLASAAYRAGVVIAPGVPEEAGQTLPAAVSVAEDLPAEMARELLDSAREAFTDGLNLAGGIGLVAMTVFGVLALVLLRPVSPTGPHEEERERPRTPDESEATDGSIPVNGPETVRTAPNDTAEEG